VVDTVLEKVDDFLIGDIDYSGALVEKAPHVLAQGLALLEGKRVEVGDVA
jgi:hypothetical protein